MNRASLLAAALLAAGCTPGPIKSVVVPVEPRPAAKAIEEVRTILQGYVGGTPYGSEEARFAMIVNEIRAEDPRKADVVESGLREVTAAQGSETGLKEKAKELLSKL
jgi:hypothetical protein